ncbi:MAG: DUF5615 family PIN-like protein [Candidatus Micrarchaeaceae archaeon]
MKFLLDANMPYSSLELLGELGHKGIRASDVGLGAAEDEEVLAYAKKTKCILISKDLDFGALIVNANKPTYGVIILRLPFTFTAIRIKSALKVFLKTVKIGNLKNAVTIVELGRYRIRKI